MKFIVIKITGDPCKGCSGTGSFAAPLRRDLPMGKPLARVTCTHCKGTGQERIEVDLQDALMELGGL